MKFNTMLANWIEEIIGNFKMISSEKQISSTREYVIWKENSEDQNLLIHAALLAYYLIH